MNLRKYKNWAATLLTLGALGWIFASVAMGGITAANKAEADATGVSDVGSLTCEDIQATADYFGYTPNLKNCQWASETSSSLSPMQDYGLLSKVQFTGGALVLASGIALFVIAKKAKRSRSASRSYTSSSKGGPEANLSERLSRISRLKQQGLLTPDEYEIQRKRILDEI